MEYSSLPKDPMVLLSFINTKLRDDYPSLDELCSSLCVKANLFFSLLSDRDSICFPRADIMFYLS